MDLDFKTYAEAVTRFNHSDTMDYKSRIAAGHQVEDKLFAALAENGVIIQRSNGNQDRNYGIDGWIVSTDGGKTQLPQRKSIQLKIRKNSSGNDILWETIKPWNPSLISSFESAGDRAFTGKDMKCVADLLLAVDKSGDLVRIRKVEETISIAKKMATELIHQMRATGRQSISTAWGTASIVKDPSQQSNYRLSGDVMKVNCFISPGTYQWKQDLRLKSQVVLV